MLLSGGRERKADPDRPAVEAIAAVEAAREAYVTEALLEAVRGAVALYQRAYRRDATRFLAHPTLAGKPLQRVTLGDVQAFATALVEPAAPLGLPSQARALAAVKSLLAFGHRLGYLSFDVGGALRLPKLKNALAERILSEADVHRLLALEPDPRNRTLLRLTYAGGLRVSELVALRWRNSSAVSSASGGSGGTTRAVIGHAPRL